MNSEQLIATLRSIKADHKLTSKQREALALAVGQAMLRQRQREACNTV